MTPDTPPDTTAIRALADAADERGFLRVGSPDVALTTATVRALCDGYDEAQRLRAAWATERDGAEGLAADLHAARQALTDLIGELRWLSAEKGTIDFPAAIRDVIKRYESKGKS